MFWLVALAITTVYGLNTSSITALRIVRVSGAWPDDKSRIESALRRFEFVPQTQIVAHDVERLLESSRGVKSSSYSGNVLGSSRVQIEYRTPVARLVSNPNLAIDATGVIFPSKAARNLHTSVGLDVKDFAPILCIADPSQVRDLANVAGKVQDLAKNHNLQLYCDEAGGLCFNIDQLLTVRLGTNERLDQKLEIVKTEVQSTPSFVAETKQLIVLDPSNPKVINR